MIKKTITYEDFEGNEVKKDFNFHIKKTNLLRLQAIDGGIVKRMKRAIKMEDNKELFDLIEDFIKYSYGERSKDGEGFIQNDELFEKFKATDAYDTLYIELITDEKAASEFINGVLPKSMAKLLEGKDLDAMKEEAEKLIAEQED